MVTHSLTDPLKLVSLSDTRWLVICDCIERILARYDSLKLNFQLESEKEKSQTARMLFEMYNDDFNRLYLIFLNPVLSELKRLSKHFESNTDDPFSVYAELQSYFLQLARRILKPQTLRVNSCEGLCNLDLSTDFCILAVNDVDLGQVFERELQQSRLSSDVKFDMKKRATAFLKELFKGLQKRLVGSFSLMTKVQKFIPKEFLSNNFKVKDFVEPFFRQEPGKLT